MSDYRLIIFDFDGTLCGPNTTLDFLKFYFSKKRIINKIKFYLVWIYAKLLKDTGLINPHRYTQIRLISLKGECAIQIHSLAKRYVSELESNCKINKDLLIVIEKHLNHNDTVIILSFGLDFIIKEFCDQFNLDIKVYSSSLESHNQLFTGKYSFDLVKHGKLEFLQNNYSAKQIYNAVYYSDDPEADGPIVHEVSEFIKVST